MKMGKRNITGWIGLLWIIAVPGNAQQLPIYSQYTDNMFIINPAVAGNDALTKINLTNRLQWLGIKDAPRTSSFSMQGRLLKRKYRLANKLFSQGTTKEKYYIPKREGKVGMGGYVYNDRNGLIERSGFQYTYVYHIFLKGFNEISFGLSLTAFQFKLDRDHIAAKDPYDPVLYSQSSKTIFVPDANFGVFWLNRKFYAGFSALQLSQSLLKFGNNAFDDYQLYRHYYLIGGYYFELNPQYRIVPSILMRSTENLHTFQSDISCRINYKNLLWGGLTYRTNHDIVFIIGGRYERFSITYAFDYPPNPIRQHSLGSHELTLAMIIGDTERRYRWLERY